LIISCDYEAVCIKILPRDGLGQGVIPFDFIDSIIRIHLLLLP